MTLQRVGMAASLCHVDCGNIACRSCRDWNDINYHWPSLEWLLSLQSIFPAEFEKSIEQVIISTYIGMVWLINQHIIRVTSIMWYQYVGPVLLTYVQRLLNLQGDFRFIKIINTLSGVCIYNFGQVAWAVTPGLVTVPTLHHSIETVTSTVEDALCCRVVLLCTTLFQAPCSEECMAWPTFPNPF